MYAEWTCKSTQTCIVFVNCNINSIFVKFFIFHVGMFWSCFIIVERKNVILSSMIKPLKFMGKPTASNTIFQRSYMYIRISFTWFYTENKTSSTNTSSMCSRAMQPLFYAYQSQAAFSFLYIFPSYPGGFTSLESVCPYRPMI